MLRIAFFTAIFCLGSALQAQSSPCADGSSSYFPRIILVGEKHKDDNSREVRELLLRGGAQGKYVVGTEVNSVNLKFTFFPKYNQKVSQYLGSRGNSKLHGIESEFALSLLDTYFAAPRSPYTDEKNLKYSIEFHLENLKQYTSHRKAAQTIRAEKNERLSSLAQSFLYVSTASEKNLSKNIQVIVSHYSAEEIFQFEQRLHKLIIEDANLNNYDELEGRRLFPIKNRKDWDRHTACAAPFCTRSQENYILEYLRNKAYAQNISDLICQYKDSEDQIFVLLGADHMDETKKYLNKIYKNNLKIETYYTHHSGKIPVLEMERAITRKNK